MIGKNLYYTENEPENFLDQFFVSREILLQILKFTEDESKSIFGTEEDERAKIIQKIKNCKKIFFLIKIRY